MPITVPTTNTPISVPNFGKPVADALNQFGTGIGFQLVNLSWSNPLTLPTGATTIGTYTLTPKPYRRLIIAYANCYFQAQTSITYVTLALSILTTGSNARIYGVAFPQSQNTVWMRTLSVNETGDVAVKLLPQTAGTITCGGGSDYNHLLIAEIPIPN